MTAQEEYERIWDLLVDTHRKAHGDHKPVAGDMNCCGEYAVMMALRTASRVKDDYPSYLLLRAATLPELDHDFYVKNVMSTDGESPPADPEALREYRAARRHHILWNELKTAAARIEALERQVERQGGGVAARPIVDHLPGGSVAVELTRSELGLLASAINEALEAVEEWEFQTRLGALPAAARELQGKLVNIVTEMRRSS